jgi:hypothetical protein
MATLGAVHAVAFLKLPTDVDQPRALSAYEGYQYQHSYEQMGWAN